MTDDRRVSILHGLAGRDDACRATRADLALIWSRLGRRELMVTDTFTTDDRSNLLLRIRKEPAGPGRERNIRLLEQALLGTTRKQLSYEVRLSGSSVAQLLKRELLDIGLDCRPSRVPQALVMLVRVACGFMDANDSSLYRFSFEGDDYLALGSRLNSPLVRALPPAVRAVVNLHAAGRSYADIASERKTSYRTVANQVADAFRRLGVSGRFDLLQRMMLTSPRVEDESVSRVG